jgi:short-subunit dehydrogenase
MKRYDDQVAVVTGASRGLGRQLAVDLARRGARVIGLARDATALDQLALDLQRLAPGSDTHVCDIGDSEEYTATLRDVYQRHGGVDVLINNAAMSEWTPVTSRDLEPFRQMTAVNYLAAVASMLEVVPKMLERGRGVIVNVSTDAVRSPSPRNGAYAASKAALSAITESFAHEVVGRSVHMHVLYPGFMPTESGLRVTDGGKGVPRFARRTVEQVSALTLDRMGGGAIDIIAVKPVIAVSVMRAVAPSLHRRLAVRATDRALSSEERATPSSG